MGSRVLILILLEYGLRQERYKGNGKKIRVLILILLEYGLRQDERVSFVLDKECLNPYSIGIWSATLSL